MTAGSLALCEGYTDRDFLGEWILRRLGCQEDRALVPRGTGTFGFRSTSGRAVVVAPLGTIAKFFERAELQIRNAVDSTDRFLAIVDGDCAPEKAIDERNRELRASMLGALQRAKAMVPEDRGDEGIRVGAATITVAAWRSNELDPSVPGREILERLIAAAIRKTKPERYEAVRRFLATRPDRPENESGKEPAFTYSGAWHPDNYGSDFFRHVWREEQLAQDLETRLEAVGVAQRVRALL